MNRMQHKVIFKQNATGFEFLLTGYYMKIKESVCYPVNL